MTFISSGDNALKEQNCALAFQCYSNAVVELKLQPELTPSEQESLAIALMKMALTKSMIIFKDLAITQNLQRAEEEILELQEEAETICENLLQGSIKKSLKTKLAHNKDKIYHYIRYCYWNEVVTFMAIATKNTQLFMSQKRLYKMILEYLKTYLYYTQEMQFLDDQTKSEEMLPAKEYQAELYDWLSDLHFDFFMLSKKPKWGSEMLEMAQKYNQKAVLLWMKIDPEKDILSLHLGYLNIIYYAFNQNFDRAYLVLASDYINKIVLNESLAAKFAKELLALETESNEDDDYYRNLAKSFLEKYETVLPDQPLLAPQNPKAVPCRAKRKLADTKSMPNEKRVLETDWSAKPGINVNPFSMRTDFSFFQEKDDDLPIDLEENLLLHFATVASSPTEG